MPELVNSRAISFDDVLLVPQYSEITSRLKVKLDTFLTPNIKLSHPICSTNMSTVTELDMMKTMCETGGAGFLHRFLSTEKILNIVQEAKDKAVYPIVVSVGVKEEDYKLVDLLMGAESRPDALLVDVAHGDSIGVVNIVKYIKNNYNIDVIAGNIATYSGAKRLADAGANGIRVGIGGGSCCTTRIQTGHGIPTLQSIIDCQPIQKKYGVTLIGDGGFRFSGDIVKALAFGADTVSLGGLLAPTSDSPGPVIHERGQTLKKTFGMSSKDAQVIYKGGMKAGIAPEGITRIIPYTGKTEDIVSELLGGIRSGLTYSGANNLIELRENSTYILLNIGAIKESKLFNGDANGH